MTSPEPPYYASRPRVRVDLVREALAAVMLVVGLAGLAYAAFGQSRELGIATVSTYFIVVGVALGLNR